MSVIPAELKYTKSHEWVKEEDGVFVIGLTDYAQSALGDLVFVNLPEEGVTLLAPRDWWCEDAEDMYATLMTTLPREDMRIVDKRERRAET